MAVLALLGGCSRADKAAQEAPRRGEMMFPVETVKLLPERVEYKITAIGSVEAFENLQVTARVAGVLETLHFREGDEVKKDALLAEIEPQRYQLAVGLAKASLDRAKASRLEAERELERMGKLTAEGVASSAELSQWQTKLATAQAEEAQAQSQLSMASLNLHDARVGAPMTGIIQTRNVQTGQYVQPGTVLATLIRKDPLLLRFKVTEDEAARLDLPMQVGFIARGGNGEKYQAKLTHIAGSAEAASRMVPVVGEVEKPGNLRPGVFAEITIPVGVSESALVVPQTAIRPSEKGFLAFIVEGGVAHERVLKLGLRTERAEAEVVSGLNAGEELVIRGAEALKEGAKVRVGGAGLRGAGSGRPQASAAPGGQP
ncbi:MAG TPA: efflux RND transporter periplasmic adaptor subunit [Polyangiaceae bacterium]|jgi:membrane fusion protein (multidrug efflux system)/multidrug efflux system membrane fusion protein|nr:efflux RND transporter periplasmic adaptor subunit [Polyangiaceae bacterium]